ncbi:MAG: hypothetical protein ACRDBY_07995 [Cetobacterium sp.]
MKNSKEFNEYYYGEIETFEKLITRKLKEAINEHLEAKGQEIDFNDFYRAVGYSLVRFVNGNSNGAVPEENRKFITEKAHEYYMDYHKSLTDSGHTHATKMLYIMPLVLNDIISYCFHASEAPSDKEDNKDA